MVISVIITAIIFIITLWYIKYNQQTKYLKRFLGPTPLPILGNSLHFISTTHILPTFLRFHQKYGGIYKVSIGFKPMTLVVTDTKFIEFLLGSNTILDKSVDYNHLHNWLGTGLLTSSGTKWKRHRKMLTSAFHFTILEQFADVFNTYADILIEKLALEVDQPSTNIYPYVTLCSLDIICASSMGTAVNAQEDSESEYVYSVKELCRIIMTRATSGLKMNDTFFYQFSRDYFKERKALKILHGYIYSVIASRKKELSKNTTDLNDNTDHELPKKKNTLLDLLLVHKKLYQNITDESIREEVDTFMFEGHDTSASGITFIFYCLARHPDIQKKVMQELLEVFADDFNRPATYKDLQKMKYLEKVIKETLRLYPSVPLYGRTNTADVEYDGAILPAGLNIVVNAFGLHRNPDIYPNPDQFDPERFTNEVQSKRSPFAYIPFSAGSRNCIGQKFAMLEMKAVVSKVLKSYEVLPSIPEVPLVLVSEAVLKSKSGVYIRLKKRRL